MNARSPNPTPLSDEPVDGELMPMTSESSLAIAAEINQQVATAKRYPRRRDKEITDEILGRAVLDESIAAECMYTLKRGDKTITGPSIRFAEIVRASYGNIRVAARFDRLDIADRDHGAVVVEAAAIDLQTNNAECIPIRRSVMTSGKNGNKARLYTADMINMTVNAACSLARRNAILAVVPKSIWIGPYQRVIKVLQGDSNTLTKRREDVLAALERAGAPRKIVFEALGVVSIEDITVEHMPELMGYINAIKEGESPDSVFGQRVAEARATPAEGGVLADKPGDEGPRPTGAEAKGVAAAAKAAEVRANAKLNDPERKQQQATDAAEAGADGQTGELIAEEGDDTAPGKTHDSEGLPMLDRGPGPRQDAPLDADEGPKQTTKPKQAAAVAPKGKPAPVDLSTITTAQQYRDHTIGPNGWVTLASSSKEVRAQWSAERSKRTDLNLADEHESMLVEISSVREAKAKELEAAGK